MKAAYFFNTLTLISASVCAAVQETTPSNAVALKNQLKAKLSCDAEIFLPADTPTWEDVTIRWSEYSRPFSGFAVQVATSKDVQETVKFARKHSIPFLVRNRGHGSVGTLAKFQGGIEIEISGLNSIRVNKAQGIAKLGGGVYNYDVIHALYSAGAQGSVGSCSCVGLMGAGLGGGHGRLQGMYGLIADSIQSANIVLSDGRMVHASATENKDLYWALKGAGHNFGIVTDLTYKVFDLVADGDWWYANYIYTKNSIKDVFTLVNNLRDIQPAELTIAIVYTWLTAEDPEPSIVVSLYYPGKVSTRKKWVSYFEGLKPVATDLGTAKWKDLSEVSFTGLNSTLCAHGYRRSQYPVSLKTLDISSVTAAYDIFTKVGLAHPDSKNSTMVFESYPLQAVKAVPEESTAYPHRDVNVIALYQGTYKDSAIDASISKYGNQIRNTLHAKSGFKTPKAYLNYAQGDEPLEVLYGSEKWRLEKLRNLKRKYDPENRFGFYEPIT